MRRLPPPPLFLQTLGLVFAALVAAQLATAVVLINLPPPAATVYSVEDVAGVFESAASTGAARTPGLVVERRASPPKEQSEGRRHTAFRAELVRTLGLDPRRLVLSAPGPGTLPFGIPRHRAPWRNPDGTAHRSFEPLMFGDFAVAVRQPDGSWLVAHTRPTPGLDPWQQRLLLVFGLAILAISPLAWVFSRRLSAPIALLSAGAQRLGNDPNAPPLVIRGGSSEVAGAVAAYNEMQGRLQSYVSERTSMVAAIAHDLRTPLTRLRFRAERAPDALRAALAADIDEMDAMIGGALSFVRDTASPMSRERLELTSLVETVMDDAAQMGGRLSFGQLERVHVPGDPLALKRLLTNLTDNALKFGGSARASVFVDDQTAVVRIEDDGTRNPGRPASPGVPPLPPGGDLAQPQHRRHGTWAGGRPGDRGLSWRRGGSEEPPRRRTLRGASSAARAPDGLTASP